MPLTLNGKPGQEVEQLTGQRISLVWFCHNTKAGVVSTAPSSKNKKKLKEQGRLRANQQRRHWWMHRSPRSERSRHKPESALKTNTRNQNLGRSQAMHESLAGNRRTQTRDREASRPGPNQNLKPATRKPESWLEPSNRTRVWLETRNRKPRSK